MHAMVYNDCGWKGSDMSKTSLVEGCGNENKESNFRSDAYLLFGGGIGWTLAIVALGGIRERLKRSPIPKALEGPGIALIITGLMALSFTAFSGMIQMQ